MINFHDLLAHAFDVSDRQGRADPGRPERHGTGT
jgi:hypothetical protein